MSNYHPPNDLLHDKEDEAPKVKSTGEPCGEELAQGQSGRLPAPDIAARVYSYAQ